MKQTCAILFAIVLAPSLISAQAPQQAGTFSIAGQQDQAPVIRIRGKVYVDIESLARVTHGSVRYVGTQTILSLPQPAPGLTPAAPTQVKTPQLSGAFLGAEIEALTGIREWRVSLVNAVQNNYPVGEEWLGRLRRSADTQLQLAVAAASTEPDQKGLELLKNEFTNMKLMSDQFVAVRANVGYVSPDSFSGNALDQKILSCERALASMAATKNFQDAPSCH